MKGPLQIIRRRREERQAPEADPPQPATEAPAQAHPAADPAPAAVDPATTAHGAAADAAPAGSEPVSERPTFRQRGRVRRRLRYLRRVRELGYRDLGGLVFDQHKFARVNEELVRGKLAALAAVDAELRSLEHALGDHRMVTELREPGVSVCPRCGALHGSDARFCPSCGVALRGPRAMAGVGESLSPAVGVSPAPPPTPAAPPQPAQPRPAEVTEDADADAAAEQRPTEVFRTVPEPVTQRSGDQP